MKNIYHNIYTDKKNLGDLTASPRIQKMVSIVDKLNPQHKNILDIGCYDGTFLNLIKNRDNNFFGLEASDWGYQKSRARGIDVQQYYFDGSEKLPYDDNFFDLVIAGEIIEHIFDTDFFLKEIRRILKTDGKLLISTPNIASFGRRLMLLLGINPIIETSPNEPESSGHIRYFTFRSLETILEKHRFKTIEYQSDIINFSKSGRFSSTLLVKLFPRFGASIICLAKKV